MLASLNHPNIAAIYGFEDSGSTHALVLELVEGPTLADRIAKGPIPLDEALPIAKQIAEALEAAHEQGIIHRDLKPANIKLRDDGTVKVLDFGLAKALEPAAAISPALTASPTITTPALMTGVGMLLGTAAYMSPEQAKGRPADKRSDIWAFGCILYEMLTQKRPFAGEDVVDTLASVLQCEPDWNALPTETAHVRSVLQRCLQKEAKGRLRDVADVTLLLEMAPASHGVTTDAPSKRIRWISATAVVSSIAAATIGLFVLSSRNRTVQLRVARFEMAMSPSEMLTTAPAGANVAISPDGSRVVYTARGGRAGRDPIPFHLVIRELDQLAARTIVGSDGGRDPFFSPDGKQIGFATLDGLKRVATEGGASAPICRLATAVFGGATWGPDDSIIFALGSEGLFRVSANGGEPQKLAAPDRTKQEVDYVRPTILPGGRAFLYTARLPAGRTRIMARTLAGDLATTVVEAGFGGQYLSSGHLVYGQGDRLMAIPFDLSTLKATGSPLSLQDGVSTKFERGVANVATASDGTGAYVSGRGEAEGRHLVWVDRHGTLVARIVAEPLELPRYPRLSPDGQRLALTIGPSNAGQIWIYDLAGSVQPSRLTYQDHNLFPIWSKPDGKRIVFISRARTDQILSIPADGSATEPERLIADQPPAVPRDWSRDGAFILFQERAHLHLLHLTDGKVSRWLETPFTDVGGRFSPDGKWLAYASNQSGTEEVWVRPFPGRGAPVRVSSDGGHDAVWSRDGKELFYRSGLKVLSARLVPGDAFRVSAPQMLFEGGFEAGSESAYDVAPDGRFVMTQTEPNDNATPASLVVVLNWTEELKQRVPVK